jgi:predicted nucleotidyltransferase
MTLPAALHDELRRYVAALDRRYGPDLVSVILFGSRARGEARPESDIDMLIVVRGLPRKRWDRYSGFRDLARQVGEEFSDAVTPVVLTPEEAQEVKPYYLGMLSGHVIRFRPGTWRFRGEEAAAQLKQVADAGARDLRVGFRGVGVDAAARFIG